MVASNDNDLQMRIAPVRLLQEMKETPLRRSGRVEHIPRYEQDIRLLFSQGIGQPGQESIVLLLPVVAEEGLAEMPVGGMYNF